MDVLDTITVEVSVNKSIQANGADLMVTVRGSSLVTGRAALKKAREVSALADALAMHGVSEEQIHIESIRASVSSGLISKSSTANFELRVRCDDLEVLGDLIGAITSQKQADLSRIEWRFPDRHKLSGQLLREAVPQAHEKARLIAELLGVELLGVHKLDEKYLSEPHPDAHYIHDHSFASVRRAGAMSSEDLGLEISHTRDFALSVKASFRVGPLGYT